MTSRRTRLYMLYALPMLGLLGLIYTAFAPLRLQSPFSQLLPQLLLLLYLILDYKAVFAKLNPGIKIKQATASQQLIQKIDVKKGWHRAGLILRLSVGILLFVWASFWFISSPRLWHYGWIGILLFFAVILIAGFVFYVKNPPQQILLTDEGIHSYLWSYLYFDWDQIKHITEKPQWISIRPEEKADHDINLDELADPANWEAFTELIQTVADYHHIPYTDLSEEYNPSI